jgi:hypothetical protein
MVPLPGEGWGDQHEPAVVAARTATARANDMALPPPDPADFGITGADRDWLLRRQVPHPFGPYREPLPFDGARWAGVPRTSSTARSRPTPPSPPCAPGCGRCRDFEVLEIATGHCPMVSAPDALVELLVRLGRRPRLAEQRGQRLRPTAPRQAAVTRRVQVRHSPIHGHGVFAIKALPAGSPVGPYTGRRHTIEEVAARDWDNALTYVFGLSDGSVIDGAEGGNATRYINHSCAPNCVAFELEDEQGRSVDRGGGADPHRAWAGTLHRLQPGHARHRRRQLCLHMWRPAVPRHHGCRSAALTPSARVKVVVALFVQPAVAHAVLSSGPQGPSRVRG